MAQQNNGITYFAGFCPKCRRTFWVDTSNKTTVCECGNELNSEAFISHYMDAVVNTQYASEFINGKSRTADDFAL